MARALPLPLRLAPGRLRGALWARWYHPPKPRWQHLFTDAPLALVPRVTMDLVAGDVISGSIAFTGCWERRASLEMVALARRGGLLVDVGANLGYFTLLWAAANPANRVIAIEPSPPNVLRLRHNVRRNGFESRVRILPFAAGQAAGRQLFDLGPPGETGMGGFTAGTVYPTTLVDVVRLDDVLAGEDVITLLKIDVEGAEPWALAGCRQLLERKAVERVWFEQNRARLRGLGLSEDEAPRLLASLGYVATPRGDPGSDVVNWRAAPS